MTACNLGMADEHLFCCMGNDTNSVASRAYCVVGVRRSDSTEVVVNVTALSEANAKCMVELDGVIVTSVEPVISSSATMHGRLQQSVLRSSTSLQTSWSYVVGMCRRCAVVAATPCAILGWIASIVQSLLFLTAWFGPLDSRRSPLLDMIELRSVNHVAYGLGLLVAPTFFGLCGTVLAVVAIIGSKHVSHRILLAIAIGLVALTILGQIQGARDPQAWYRLPMLR